VQALRWEDVDLEGGIAHIRRTYVKSESRFRNYPKGKRHHSKRIPPELLAKLKDARELSATELVVVPPGWKMLDYWKYLRVLKQLCKKAKVPVIPTHSLRHSSSELWILHRLIQARKHHLVGESSCEKIQPI
jgi:integrase